MSMSGIQIKLFSMKRIIREDNDDFDWIRNVPNIVSITHPVTQKNPKNSFRLYWYLEYGHVWADNWVTIPNDPRGVDKLTFLIKVLKYYGMTGDGFDNIEISNALISGELNSYGIFNPPLNTSGDEYDDFTDSVYDYLNDIGFLIYDDGRDDYCEVQKIWVRYYDEYGVEYETEIKI